MDRLGRLVTALRTLLLASLAIGTHVPGPGLAQEDRDESDWVAARADGSRRAFERYLQRYPLGRHASEAFIAIARMSVEPGWTPAPGESVLPEAGRTVAAPNDVY